MIENTGVKERTTKQSVPNALGVRFDRIESQIRLLADSAFVMRDYDTAAEMYRMARDDFKSDR